MYFRVGLSRILTFFAIDYDTVTAVEFAKKAPHPCRGVAASRSEVLPIALQRILVNLVPVNL
jgi:hypothetical protein